MQTCTHAWVALVPEGAAAAGCSWDRAADALMRCDDAIKHLGQLAVVTSSVLEVKNKAALLLFATQVAPQECASLWM